MIHSGMVSDVGLTVLAAPSTIHHAWFCKQLPQPTTNNIELRVCGGTDSELRHSTGDGAWKYMSSKPCSTIQMYTVTVVLIALTCM